MEHPPSKSISLDLNELRLHGTFLLSHFPFPFSSRSTSKKPPFLCVLYTSLSIPYKTSHFQSRYRLLESPEPFFSCFPLPTAKHHQTSNKTHFLRQTKQYSNDQKEQQTTISTALAPSSPLLPPSPLFLVASFFFFFTFYNINLLSRAFDHNPHSTRGVA